MFLKAGRNKVSLARNSRVWHAISKRTNVVTQPSHHRCALVSGKRSFSSLPSNNNDDENRLVVPETPIDFAVSSKIEGEESQIATVELKPGEKLRAESGAMLFMTQGVEMATNLEGASSAFRRTTVRPVAYANCASGA